MSTKNPEHNQLFRAVVKRFSVVEWAAILLLLLGIVFMCGLCIGLRSTQIVSLPNQRLISQTQLPQTSELLNINTATAEELETLPGIGEVLAKRIVDYRESCGAFLAVEELCSVEGIGEKRLEALKEYITVG